MAAVAEHLGHLGGAGLVGRALPVRLCLYGLTLTFAGFAVFLCFAPSLIVPPASSPGVAWFDDGLIASASPYRAQVSGFLSSLFPANSSSTVPPGGVAVSCSRGNGSSAVRRGEQLGSGGGAPVSSKEAPVPGDATAAVLSGAAPDDRMQGGAEAKHSAGSAAVESKGGPGPGLASGGSAQSVTSAKGGVPVRINGSDDTNARSVDAGDGNGVRASARNTAGSTHQLGSGTAALVNGATASFLNQTASEVAAAMDGNGSAAAVNNQTVPIQAPADSKSHSSAASDGSNSTAANKQNESTASPQGSTSPVKDRSARGATPTASDNGDVPVEADANAGWRMKADWIENMARCDMFYGNWVRDDSYPLYPAGSCPHVDESFNCHLNGRPDKAYERLRWQPSGCRIPR